jgi:hypothetical protein
MQAVGVTLAQLLAGLAFERPSDLDGVVFRVPCFLHDVPCFLHEGLFFGGGERLCLVLTEWCFGFELRVLRGLGPVASMSGPFCMILTQFFTN